MARTGKGSYCDGPAPSRLGWGALFPDHRHLIKDPVRSPALLKKERFHAPLFSPGEAPPFPLPCSAQVVGGNTRTGNCSSADRGRTLPSFWGVSPPLIAPLRQHKGRLPTGHEPDTGKARTSFSSEALTAQARPQPGPTPDPPVFWDSDWGEHSGSRKPRFRANGFAPTASLSCLLAVCGHEESLIYIISQKPLEDFI